MSFITEMNFEKIEGFLDTEEAIYDVRASLEQETETAYRQFDIAKMAALETAQNIFLD